jgi:hypothetical protein
MWRSLLSKEVGFEPLVSSHLKRIQKTYCKAYCGVCNVGIGVQCDYLAGRSVIYSALRAEKRS